MEPEDKQVELRDSRLFHMVHGLWPWQAEALDKWRYDRWVEWKRAAAATAAAECDRVLDALEI